MSISDDSNNAGGGSAKGLFQRVLKLVSHKSVEKSRTGELAPEEKAQMMLRKQRHDLARRSEFNKLRGLLREQEAAEKSHHSSIGLHSDKPNSRQLETIKKINALENEMVNRFSQQINDLPSKQSTRGPSTLSSPSIQVDSSGSEFSSSFYASDLNFKTSSQHSVNPVSAETIKPVDLPVEYEVKRDPNEEVLDFFDSATDLPDVVNDEELNLLSDPMLEENAVLFASNEDEQVERNLRAMLTKDSAYRNNRVAWLVLMDFYRAVGNQPAFEKLAMDYTTIFSESAPQWVIFDPVVVKKMQAKNASSGMIYWQSPAIFDEAAALDMEEKFSSEDKKVPRLMDWNLIKEINGKSAKIAVKLLLSLDKPGIALQVTGLRVVLALLDQLIRHHNENSDLRSLWQMRLELLKLFDSQEEFDMQAMEYCLEFEVSPPDWIKPQCKVEDLDKEVTADDSTPGSRQGQDSTILSAHNNTTMLTHVATGFYSHSVATLLRLYGDLKGSIVEELERFDDKVPKDGGFLRINCERLVRIDFVAAGDLLNWVSDKAAKGYSVQLLRVNRLVALFFIVMGISVPAHIALRKD